MVSLLTLLAQYYDDFDTVTPEEAAEASAALTGGIFAFTGLWLFFWGLIMLVYLIFFIWWIVLLIDLVKRDFPEKNTWLIIMIILFIVGLAWLACLLYYFSVVRKGKGSTGGSQAPPQSQPPTQEPPASEPPTQTPPAGPPPSPPAQ